MAGVWSRPSFNTATTIQQPENNSNNENTVKSIAFWLSIWKKWCLEKGIAKAEMKITSRSSLTLCTSDSTPKLKQTWLNLANDDFIPSKVIRTQTEQFLELFCRTLSFFVPYRCENIIEYYCFDLKPLFWPNAQFWTNYFCTWCARFASKLHQKNHVITY